MKQLSPAGSHWPEYLIEGWALGVFMISAGVFSVLFEAPHSWLHSAIENPLLRRASIGCAMGLTAIALIYSRFGQRSGAHMNPAVTLTYWSIGRVTTRDAVGYILAQCVGGTLGVILVASVLGDVFTAPPVAYVATLPGDAGNLAAFSAEIAIAFIMMSTILIVSNNPTLQRYTGCCAGGLVALYITFEAPLSGMSMNPARSLAAALPSGLWHGFWIYVTAPVLGMTAAAQCYRAFSARGVHCAKLLHPDDLRCIHCGLNPARLTTLT